jgi:hypothetical protein
MCGVMKQDCDVGWIQIIPAYFPVRSRGTTYGLERDIPPIQSPVLLTAIASNWTKVQNRVVIHFLCRYFCIHIERHITPLER